MHLLDTGGSGLSNGTKETPLGLLEAMGYFLMYSSETALKTSVPLCKRQRFQDTHKAGGTNLENMYDNMQPLLSSAQAFPDMKLSHIIHDYRLHFLATV